jgi:anti-sigma B factor antagonist
MLKVYKRKIGDVAVLCLQGQLVTGETEILRAAVASQPNAGALVLDLRRVRTIDAGGLGVLLELREQTLLKGMEFILTNVTKLVQQVLEVTRLNTVFEISYRESDLCLIEDVQPSVINEPATLVCYYS